MERKALKLALEALEGLFEGGGVSVWRLGGSAQPRQAIIAIKEALAQPVQEPVACLDCGSHNVGIPATYDSLINSVKALNT